MAKHHKINENLHLVRAKGVGITLPKLLTTLIQSTHSHRLLTLNWGLQYQPLMPMLTSLPGSQVLNQKIPTSKKNARLSLKTLENCPTTWTSIFDVQFGQPVVVRPYKHSKGREFYLVHNYDELEQAWFKCGPEPYATPYFEKKKEYRVFVFGGAVVWVAEKVPNDPDAVVWNVDAGNSVFKNVKWSNWPKQICKSSIESVNTLGMDFGAVDVIVTDNNHWIIEVNSAPSLPFREDGKPSYRQRCFLKALTWTLEGKEVEQGVVQHPALGEN